MDIKDYRVCYQILSQVLIDGAFINIALDNGIKNCNCIDTAAITFLCYGVVENDRVLSAHLNQFVQKHPKPPVVVLLKIGLFGVHFMNTPTHFVIDKIVELTKQIGKGGVSGFVNAVLRKSSQTELTKCCIADSYPVWIRQKLIYDLDLETAYKIMDCDLGNLTHIRPNLLKIDQNQFEQIIKDVSKINGAKCQRTVLGYNVNGVVMRQLDGSLFTAQSLGSMFVVESVGRQSDLNILDLCAAPGGKSIYALQNNKDSKVTSCDIYPHRLNLIKDYAKRLGANLTIIKNDATVLNKAWIGKFDLAMCDVPCSGLGVVSAKPDILNNLQFDDIEELNKIQLAIVNNAAKYVKVDGKLLYSTCTYFCAENEHIVQNFLKANPNFVKLKIENEFVKSDDEGYIKIYPHIDQTQGFFACVMKNKGNKE